MRETKKNIYIENKNISYLANAYIKRKKWFYCITMLEYCIHYNQIARDKPKNRAIYYNYLGLCYQMIKMNKIAEKYYSKAKL